jgi:hypothetical protein
MYDYQLLCDSVQISCNTNWAQISNYVLHMVNVFWNLFFIFICDISTIFHSIIQQGRWTQGWVDQNMVEKKSHKSIWETFPLYFFQSLRWLGV